MLFFTVTRTIIDQVEINVSSACPKCGAGTWFVNTMEGEVSVLFGSTTQVKAEVVCAECGKRIRKSLWPIEVVDLVAQKNKEFKPSFFKRFGFMIILLSLFIVLVSYVVIDAVLDHKKLMYNAHTNFAKCYDSKIKEEWYNGLDAGDFILANKNYNEPAQVFRIRSIDDKVVVLDAFKQYISGDDYQELESLNELKLGEGDFTEYRVKKKHFMRGILEEESDNMGGPRNMYIKQIRKK